jgi:hypothetical protein
MKNNNAFELVVYWVATVAAIGTLVTHVTQWSRHSNEMQAASAAHSLAQIPEPKTDLKSSAPYRDGMYLAKLAQQRGEQHNPSVGRWATLEQREAFSAGYSKASHRVAQAAEGN